MPAFDRPESQRIITSTLAWTALWAVVIFVALLILSAANFGTASAGQLHGPLDLFLITKTPRADGATEISMGFGEGASVFAAAMSAVALAVIAFRLRRRRA